MLEGAYPQFVAGCQEPVDVMIGYAAFYRSRLETGKRPFSRREFVDAPILRSDPETSEPVLGYLMDGVTAQRGRPRAREEFLEKNKPFG